VVVVFGLIYARRSLEELRQQEGARQAAALGELGGGEPAARQGELAQPMLSFRTASMDDV
jgi:hypothetical protein